MRLRPICVADNFAHFIFVLSSQNLGRLVGAHTSNGFSEKLRQFVSHSISNNVFFKCRSWRRLNVTSRVMSCKSIYTSICNKEIIMRVTMLYSVASQIFSIFLIVVKNVSRVGREGVWWVWWSICTMSPYPAQFNKHALYDNYFHSRWCPSH